MSVHTLMGFLFFTEIVVRFSVLSQEIGHIRQKRIEAEGSLSSVGMS